MIKVYIKGSCPWCIELEAFLNTSNIQYERIDVSIDPLKFEEMKELSGQDKAPTVVLDDEVFADTDADQIKSILKEKGIYKSDDES